MHVFTHSSGSWARQRHSSAVLTPKHATLIVAVNGLTLDASWEESVSRRNTLIAPTDLQILPSQP